MKKLVSILCLSVAFFACQNDNGTQTNSEISTSITSPAVVTEADYQVVVPIRDLPHINIEDLRADEKEPHKEFLNRIANSFMAIENNLKAKGYQVTDYCFSRDSVKIVDKNSKFVKYVSVEVQMRDECCGIVAAKTGKEPLYIYLRPETSQMVEELENYFK